MPRTALPPTPASSTDIKGQDGGKQLATLQMAFELPPPAINAPAAATQREAGAIGGTAQPSPPASEKTSPRTPYPLTASETVKSRRRSSAAKDHQQQQQFALPPPPTRSRKIIQMKPRQEEEFGQGSADASSSAGSSRPSLVSRNSTMTAGAGVPAAQPSTAVTPAKRKQPSSTSAAGRKAARKTAHSLIERRRRSKMNEEFAVLKNMIPACTGEMHKLAILQASIEYVRYLEDCITKLQSQRGRPDDGSLSTPIGREGFHPNPHNYQDVDMPDSAQPSPTFTATHSQATRSAQPSISPALLAEDSRHRQDSYSSASASASTDHHRHYSYGASATTSPAFGPQSHSGGGYSYAHSTHTHSAAGSTLTSPALAPQRDRDLDQEATAALLMLNSDRRGTLAGAAGRGMSVRDLLST